MENAETILVIILSTFLAIFIAIGITVFLNINKLVKTMNEIAEKARLVVDDVETAAQMFKKASGPMAFGRTFVDIANSVMNHKKGK